MRNFFKIYLLPGITFQSIVISGGYCTGQEIVQYFLIHGKVNGFYGLLITTIVWSLICAFCFILAKAYHAYDYKTFFKILLGRAWFLFEICYLYVVLIALSVIAASVGSLLEDLLGLPYQIGLVLPFLYILMMIARGSSSIEKMFSFWSLLLYLVFIAFLICCYYHWQDLTFKSFIAAPTGWTWLKSSLSYAGYNICCLPAILFTLRHFKTNKQAIISGLLAGPFASIPGILLFIVLSCAYPAILKTTVPSTYILDILSIPILTIAFSIVLIGTLIETGVGLVHAVNERIAIHSDDRHFKSFPIRHVIIGIILLLAFALSHFGLINLIVKGYGLLTWVTLGIFIIPLLTTGMIKILKKDFALLDRVE